ncbi:MAG: putative signal transducing protein [Mesonia hippocampi]|uniref:putative signal transducing protein n=1 Tax=Mesonia hippocampi TaxID=1628250 RepID=UPI003F944904
MDNYIKILTDSSIVINRIAYLLKENNIVTNIVDNVESARLAGFGSPINNVELYVLKSDFKKAEQVIKEFKAREL